MTVEIQHGVAVFPAPVIAVVDDEITERSLGDFTASADDAYWARFVRLPFTWDRFLTWWLARRWVEPRGRHETG